MTHPVALVALAVLLLNDHVLKPLWPGAVTGKVSDVAGPVVVACLLGALWRRREAAVWWAVGVAFVLMKTVPFVNDAVPLAGTLDPWDALGVVALPVAWRLTRRPVSWRPGRVARSVAIVVAVVAITATTTGKPSVRRLVVSGGTVRAFGTTFSNDAYEWRSDDAGRTWRQVTHVELSAGVEDSPLEPPGTARTSACLGTRCYRIGKDGLEESSDGGRTWSASDIDPDWPPRDLVFAGDTVIVAVSHDGVLRRTGDGPWEAVDVARGHGPPQPESLLPVPYGVFALVAGLWVGGWVLMLGWLVFLAVRRRRSRQPAV